MILGYGGTVSIFTLGADQGSPMVYNAGNGPAINVRYDFAAIGLPPGVTIPHPAGSIPVVNAAQRVTIPVSVSLLDGHEWLVTLAYESLGKRKYVSRLKLVHNVIAEFHVAELDPR